MWDYLELTKPNVVWLILMSTMVGFYVASSDALSAILMLNTIAATALLAAGTGTLNQWWERDLDRKMRRTESRPLPSGRVPAAASLGFGIAVSIAGLAWMAIGVNWLSFWVGLATLLSYVLAYTPLKTKTPLATFVGAFPGAAPLLLGWTAVRGELSLEAWVLFFILFLWQFPHFYAIAWIYRDDYARAGIQMLPVVDRDGDSTSRQIICYAFNLIPVSIAPWMLGMAGPVYGVAALALSCGYFYYGFRAARARTIAEARRLLRVSVIYLPLLYLFLVADKA
ncbi:MAG: protoheme IX farnesyltransferase [Acidobacteria bacterium]|nr:protoheme IX farnesyltransferase [Acidobacteriota bacterium]